MIRSLNATVKVGALLVLVVAGVLLSGLAEATGPGNSIVTADSLGGRYTSLAMDSSGNPVIGYNRTGPSGGLAVLHCGNPDCTSGNSFEVVDTSVSTAWVSLVLDASGYPVISRHGSGGLLRMVHCNDPNCSGGDENASTVDTVSGGVVQYTSLQLDSSGNPVVSYKARIAGDGDLRILHCGDPNCNSGNSVESPDTVEDVGQYTSLELDSAGNPVVSYFDDTNNILKLLHCGDPDCSSGNSIETPGTSTSNHGRFNSLALDASGNPVISYEDQSAAKPLTILHCGDPNCSSGNSIERLDTGGITDTSLVLDAAGNPVVSYRDRVNNDLKVLHCGNPNCTAGNSIVSADTLGDLGEFTSIALDAEGNPVVSYLHRSPSFELKVLHCSDPNCTGEKPPTPTPTITPTPTPGVAAVGGIALDGDVALRPLKSPESSSRSFGLLAWAIAAGAGAAALGGTAWYARRRVAQ